MTKTFKDGTFKLEVEYDLAYETLTIDIANGRDGLGFKLYEDDIYKLADFVQKVKGEHRLSMA